MASVTTCWGIGTTADARETAPAAASAVTVEDGRIASISAQAEALFLAGAEPRSDVSAGKVRELAVEARATSSSVMTLIGAPFTQDVNRYRKWLISRGEAYDSARTSVDVISSRVEGNQRIVTVNETTMLAYKKISGGEPPETGYTAKHELVFRTDPVDNVLTLVEDRQLEPTGLLPLGEAMKYTVGGANSQFKAEPDPSEGEDESAPASTVRQSGPSLGGGKVTSPNTLIAGLSYTAMGAYLERYWQNYNPAYRSFTGTGGDCTNFVSQALKAGGWSDANGSAGDYHAWWYVSLTQTKSWAAVDWWASFARSSGRTTTLGNVWDLRLGDVLQVDGNKNGTKDHTTMVSYYSTKPYFTYHSTNRFRRSMDQVLADWGAANYYAYRT
ncbi:amidase domain-containing protein [Calidifontibacter indicus]|uniref:amidase domain-containing protein n=1 Tax=Calidifontibacter indicus TaxID=419650 RepID=UPI003D734343